MACNGNNHPPHCSCDFRGGRWGGYRNFDPLSHALSPRPRQLGRQLGTTTTLAGGYTNPTARCPQCGSRVYFYQSPYGGRVYFDSLGPPWPKHPCTDRSQASQTAAQYSSWHTNLWTPLTHATIDEVSPVRQIYRISGFVANRECSFFFRAEDVVMAEMVRIKKIGRGKFSLSILDFNTVDKTWCTWSGIARTESAHSYIDSPLSQSNRWSDLAEEPFSSIPNASSKWTTCPECKVELLQENLDRHMKKCNLPSANRQAPA